MGCFANRGKGKRKPNLGGMAVGRLNTRDKTQNLSLKEITDKKGPVPIQFELRDKQTVMPLGDHATHWSSYIKEVIRGVPLYYPSWLKVPKERKVAFITDIGTRFDLRPHMKSPDWTEINAGIQQHLQKAYNTNKAAFKAQHWRHNSTTQEYPSLIDTFFVSHTVNGEFLLDEDRRIYEEMRRFEATGTYTDDEINRLARGGKQRRHIPGAGRVLPARATARPSGASGSGGCEDDEDEDGDDDTYCDEFIQVLVQTRFDLRPHMKSPDWTEINAGIQQHLQKAYNTNKAAFKAQHWVINPTIRTYNAEKIRQARPENITASEWDKGITQPLRSTRRSLTPSSCHTLLMGNSFWMRTDEEMRRFEATGTYTGDEINRLARGGKQRRHIPGVGRVLPARATARPSTPSHESTLNNLHKKMDFITSLFKSDSKYSDMFSQFKSGGASGSGGCGDDEDEDDDGDTYFKIYSLKSSWNEGIDSRQLAKSAAKGLLLAVYGGRAVERDEFSPQQPPQTYRHERLTNKAMMSLLVGRKIGKAVCILAWQLTIVAAMADVHCFSDGLPFCANIYIF
nr:F-box domain, leucine-rich repeat domain, L domain-like protein [Tanacetum cinerariifolium]